LTEHPTFVSVLLKIPKKGFVTPRSHFAKLPQSNTPSYVPKLFYWSKFKFRETSCAELKFWKAKPNLLRYDPKLTIANIFGCCLLALHT